jgi:sugar phosphate permease
MRYLKPIKITGIDVSSQDAANFSIWFDVGGMIGCILAGFSSDFTGMPASVCSVMLITAIPLVTNHVFTFDIFRFTRYLRIYVTLQR